MLGVDQTLMRKRVQRLHFVGIGGAGMGGIAEVMINQGFHISGSDAAPNPLISRLQGLGAQIHIGHQADWVKGADVVVISSAIPPDNPEVQYAHQLHIPVVHRAEMLAELMRFHEGIAVAGTHGKTTTTSLIASIFSEAGLDPTFVIGGLVHQLGGHAKLGQSRHFIVEADESDASFLCLYPTVAVVTNVDQDHMEQYEHDPQILKKAFVDFLHRLPFYGLSVICWDDPGARDLLPHVKTPVRTYGFENGADLQARRWRTQGLQSIFNVVDKTDGTHWEDMVLNIGGAHNVLNALAAIAVAREAGIGYASIARVLSQFKGVGRRFEWVGQFPCAEGGVYEVIDDYGHHPREIAATLETIRVTWPNRRVVMVFQPHRYSRTRDLFQDFVSVLAQVDQVILLDVYAASEAPIPGADGQALAAAIRKRGRPNTVFINTLSQVPEQIQPLLQPGDLLVLQGAGNIGELAAQWSHPVVQATNRC